MGFLLISTYNMTIYFKNCTHDYHEIIDALKENLPDAYLLDATEREECLKAVGVIERVFSRLKNSGGSQA